MFTDKICPHCHDTGTTTKGAADGYLDCTHCEAADLRAGLERHLRTQRPGGQIHAVNPAREWAAYKLAYAKALADVRAQKEQS